jgi:hypothetical protein
LRHSGLADQRFGCGTVLGCAGRACMRARGLAHGAWRVHRVAGDESDAAGATRHGVLRIHLQDPARDETWLALTDVLCGDNEFGAKVAQRL